VLKLAVWQVKGVEADGMLKLSRIYRWKQLFSVLDYFIVTMETITATLSSQLE
jgi:hypothetical protein